MIKSALSDCQTVVWNGPMGVFEFEKFATGTKVSLTHPQIASAHTELHSLSACTVALGDFLSTRVLTVVFWALSAHLLVSLGLFFSTL